MPTKTGTPSQPISQRQRFEDAARALGCDDDEAAFDAKLGKLARAKVEPVPKPLKPAAAKRERQRGQ